MNRVLTFALILLVSICGELLLENRAVRQDQNAMKEAYAGFLARKAGGKALGSLIHPNSLAVFKSQAGLVGCAVMK